MIVLDASAMVEALVGQDIDVGLLDLLAEEIAAPHLLDVEVMSALRGLERGGRLQTEVADRARNEYVGFDIARHEFVPLAERVWRLRHRFTSYDACYLALAEALDAPLVTCDSKLDTTGHRAAIVVMSRTQ